MDTSPLPNPVPIPVPRQGAAAFGLVVMVVRALALIHAPAAISDAQELVLEGAVASSVRANASPTATKAQPESETKTSAHRNLQVLPTEITEGALLDVMLENLHGLGLPRRAGEGCLYCHVGSLEISRSQWDYASDANPKKAKARAMMTMVREINQRHLASLEHRLDSELTVTCHTCHAGRPDPSPLPDLLLRRYRDGGIQALETAYRQARERYYAAGVYDFRVSTLARVARQLKETGSAEDGVKVHELNVAVNSGPGGDSGARTALIQYRMLLAFEGDGIEALLAEYHKLKAEQPAEAFTPPLLDSLGWQILRGGDPEAGRKLFELNFAEHADSFSAHESLAYALSMNGQAERGLALAQAWLEKNPGHETGLQLLDELRGKHDR